METKHNLMSALRFFCVVGFTLLFFNGWYLGGSGDQESEYTDFEFRTFREWGIRQDDSDLQDLIKKAAIIKSFAAQCNTMDCPQINCQQGLGTLQHLEKAGRMLADTLTAMSRLNKIALNHWNGLLNEAKITGENLARAMNAMAIQEWLHGIGTTMLDIADMRDFWEGIRKDPSKLKSLGAEDLVNNAWKLHKLALNIESFFSSIRKGLMGTETPKAIAGLTPDSFGLTGSDLNLMKGIAGEVLGAMTSFKNFDAFQDAKGKGTWRNALKRPDKWRAALTRPGGPRTNILSLAGMFAAKWSESEIQKRKEFIASLNNQLTATDIVKSNAFMTLMRVQARRFIVEDAKNAVEDARAALYSCLQKAECSMMDDRGIPIRTWNFTLKDERGLSDTLGNLLLELDVRRRHLGAPLPELKECTKVGEKPDKEEEGIILEKDKPRIQENTPESYRSKSIQNWAGIWKTSVGFIRISANMEMEIVTWEKIEPTFKQEQLANVNTTWARRGFKLKVESVNSSVITGRYYSDYETGTFLWKMVNSNLENNVHYAKQFTGYRIQEGKTNKTRFRGFLLRQ